MLVELNDLITWAALVIGVAGSFYHLRGRISVVEALQKRDREDFREIKEGIKRIEEKLAEKADK